MPRGGEPGKSINAGLARAHVSPRQRRHRRSELYAACSHFVSIISFSFSDQALK